MQQPCIMQELYMVHGLYPREAGAWCCRGWVACKDIDATTVSTEPLIVIPFGLRLSSQDAAQAVQQRCSQAWDDGLMEVVKTFGSKHAGCM